MATRNDGIKRQLCNSTASTATAAGGGGGKRRKKNKSKSVLGKAGERSQAQTEAALNAAKDLIASFAQPCVVAYTDGACVPNPGPAGAGAYIEYPRDFLLRVKAAQQPMPAREASHALGHGTNQSSELTAMLLALEMITKESERLLMPPPSKVLVPPSSPIGVGVGVDDETTTTAATTKPVAEASTICRGVHILTDSNYVCGLLVRNWNANANRELVASVRSALATCRDRMYPATVDVHWVGGHCGLPGNELADRLADEAARSQM